MDGIGRHYTKWNKWDRERQVLYDITYKVKSEIKHTREYDKK